MTVRRSSQSTKYHTILQSIGLNAYALFSSGVEYEKLVLFNLYPAEYEKLVTSNTSTTSALYSGTVLAHHRGNAPQC